MTELRMAEGIATSADAGGVRGAHGADDAEMHSWTDVFRAMRRRMLLIIASAVLAGVAGYGASFLLPVLYTSQTVFLPPQAQRSAAVSTASAALGSLGALAGVGLGTTPSDQFVALMQSRSAFDRVIDEFNLIQVYDAKLRVNAHARLAKLSSFAVGKKDGLITVAVQDEDPMRAARIANRFVTILQEMSSHLALTDAQQRRRFFEGHLESSRAKLLDAQRKLQSAGFDRGALQAEPRSAAEGFARLRAEVTAAEVRLQSMTGRFTDTAPEIAQQRAVLAALRDELRRTEASAVPRPAASGPSNDYLTNFRDFKYQETLFEMYARQFELARADESRESMPIQVIDAAVPAERRSSPQRSVVALAAAAVAALAVSLYAIVRAPRARRT